jgi:hypothetical protein
MVITFMALTKLGSIALPLVVAAVVLLTIIKFIKILIKCFDKSEE